MHVLKVGNDYHLRSSRAAVRTAYVTLSTNLLWSSEGKGLEVVLCCSRMRKCQVMRVTLLISYDKNHNHKEGGSLLGTKQANQK